MQQRRGYLTHTMINLYFHALVMSFTRDKTLRIFRACVMLRKVRTKLTTPTTVTWQFELRTFEA
ncbi:hypothetical protein SOVF_164930 isoform B [Spinacia oleracea]|nr:hypothetical protein SOVF_164930 isoform B [Spinacia oleracea]